jgi:hypothetical protein
VGKLNYRPKEVTHALENKLEISFHTGKERNGWYMLDGRKVLRFTIPHEHGTWGKGTMHDIVRKSMLDKDEFRDLVSCPMTSGDYEALIRERKGL